MGRSWNSGRSWGMRMCASFSCYVPIIVKTRNIKNGRYIATYLGNAVRSTWPRILYIWEKAKGCSSTNYRHRSIYHSVFYIERIHACNFRRRFSGSTIFCKNIRLITVGEHLWSLKRGKYAGRVVADVKLNNGDNLAAKIISQGLGREYHGGAREGWCLAE